MAMDRREFLRLAGLTCIGIGAAGAQLFVRAKVASSDYGPTPNNLTARRWAMVIDLRKFQTEEDYQRVIEACHKAHNVPNIPDKAHEIKWIWTEDYEHSFPGQMNPYLPREVEERPVLLLCNHCTKAPCTRVCPTKATFKRPDGITAQDYHRCIGCRFCMAACPYGARSFNWVNPRPFIKDPNPNYPTRCPGVVEKCTFCVERLADGKEPYCVEASRGAMIFGDLEDPNSEVRRYLAENFNIRRKPELGTQPAVFYVI
ncbi:MAG: 4Fe-4S dicluster domain-containing protein [Nitrospirae bacterium]|nr:MAG: 4Fe-4S dicluster domain-containing protein [Nitrospirota bacterium]